MGRWQGYIGEEDLREGSPTISTFPCDGLCPTWAYDFRSGFKEQSDGPFVQSKTWQFQLA
jgi:hypothetical protein